MKCEKTMEKYLEQDDYTRLPIMLRMHLLFCRRCRNEIRLLSDTMDYFQETSPFHMDRDISESVMNRILKLDENYSHTMSNFKWLAVGSFIILSIMALPFNESFTWMKGHFGGNLEIPLTMVMGVGITIYVSLFAGTHPEAFQYRDKIERFIHRIIP